MRARTCTGAGADGATPTCAPGAVERRVLSGDLVARSAVLVALVACAACGRSQPAGDAGDDSPIDGAADDAPPPVDAPPPAVLAILPAPDTALWIHDPIRIRLNQPVDPATATATTIRITDGTGATIAAAIAVSADATEVTAQVTADTARIGTIAFDADGLTTAGGAAFPAAHASWPVPAWHRPTSAPDPAPPGRPAIAARSTGEVVVAYATAGDTIAVAAIHDGAWLPLGDPLGANASAPTLAVDGMDRVIAAWHQPGGIRAARWDGSAWTTLANPGSGAAAQLASAADPVIAIRTSGAIKLRRLTGDTWDVCSADIADTASDTPTVATAGTTIAVAYLDGNHRLRVRIADGGGAWAGPSALALPAPPAAQGTPDHPIVVTAAGTAVVAYDWYDPHSWSAHVARATASGWTTLGGELDLDPPGDARGLGLAVDDTGAPVVAWAELADSLQRGHLARWDGGAWQLIANDTWAGDPARTASTPAFVLARGRVPVIAYRAADFTAGANAPRAIEVARWNGPAGPRYGLDGHSGSATCAIGTTPPSTLSATGCFTIAGGHATPTAALVPFDLVDELWSDGAVKRRWIVIPDGGTVTANATGAWSVPVGTRLVKEFSIETTPGDPTTRRPMETRFLIRRDASTWEGYSYEWRADGTDADLGDGSASYTRNWPLDGGGVHTHTYPSRTDCLRCHNGSIGRVLGLRTGELARAVDYDGVAADQLATLAYAGVIDAVPASGAFADYHDPTESLERRVRGYVQANCSDCHNPAGECPQLDMRWETALADTRMCDLVVPGSPGSSVLYQKIASRPGMPPLATLVTDPLIVDVMGEWIQSMSSCP